MNPISQYLEDLEARYTKLEARLRELEAELDQLRPQAAKPQLLIGPTAAANFLNEHTANRPISAKVVTNYAGQGKIPTAGMVGSRYTFNAADLIAWDRAGRPVVREFLKTRI